MTRDVLVVVQRLVPCTCRQYCCLSRASVARTRDWLTAARPAPTLRGNGQRQRVMPIDLASRASNSSRESIRVVFTSEFDGGTRSSCRSFGHASRPANKCICIVDGTAPTEIIAALGALGAESTPAGAKRLDVIRAADAYLRSGKFSCIWGGNCEVCPESELLSQPSAWSQRSFPHRKETNTRSP